MEDNLNAYDFTLTDDEMKQLSNLTQDTCQVRANPRMMMIKLCCGLASEVYVKTMVLSLNAHKLCSWTLPSTSVPSKVPVNAPSSMFAVKLK